MKYSILFILCFSLFSQDVDIESDGEHGFAYSFGDLDNKIIEFNDSGDLLYHKKKRSTQVIYEDGNYYVYSFAKKTKEKKKSDKEKKRSKRLRAHGDNFFFKGKNHFVIGNDGYTRKVVPEKFVKSDFVVTAENIKEARLEEVKSSKMDEEEQEALIEAIESTNFERKAKELSYLVNIIRDFKNKGKIIRK